MKERYQYVDILEQMLKQKLVMKQSHPEYPLSIYNYTPATQFERQWNEVTLQCRGLILNDDYEVVARPFNKFFNLEELENVALPNETFQVYEKMDGSLGILYWYHNDVFIATRGSFTSVQAMKATEILKSKYQDIIPKLDKDCTYLFEIIYPENRIVLDYGLMEDIVLIGIIHTSSGLELPLQEIGFPLVKQYDGMKDLKLLKQINEPNKEGYVIRYEGGYRLKIKFDEYIRIHRIVTGVSTLSIWEFLSSDMSLDILLESVPDEFYEWVKGVKADLLEQFHHIESICKSEYKEFETRKETALYFQSCSYPAILFAMLTNKNYKKIIWKKIRPAYARPFSNEKE